jgi:hypothetical protein
VLERRANLELEFAILVTPQTTVGQVIPLHQNSRTLQLLAEIWQFV